MFTFLHAYHPSPILISFGPINIYWYGFFIILGIGASFLVTLKLAGYYFRRPTSYGLIFDLAFYLIIFGLIGARIYHVLLEWQYYLAHPLNIFKIWQGGLAIHGGIIVGVIVIWVFARRGKELFWLLAALIAPGMALAQAIGRWGNYFNQELFGRPTDLPWGIPINIMNRPTEYISAEYFHPTFLYESIGNFLIFLILICLYIYLIKKNKLSTFNFQLLTFSYLILYSLLRFSLEFIRIDKTPVVAGLRWPQIASIIIIIASAIILLKKIKRRDNINTTLTQ